MPSSATKQRLQDNGDTAQVELSSIELTDSAAATCLRGLVLASQVQPVFSLAHQNAVAKLRVLCAELVAKKPTLETAEKPTGASHEFHDRPEQMLRAAGCAYAKAIANAQIAKAQAEMMARVLSEQQAIAEKRGRVVAEDRVEVPAAVAQPLRLVARRAADVILFRKRKRSLSYSPVH